MFIDTKQFIPSSSIRTRGAVHAITCTSYDYARAYARAMISNPALHATPELNLLKLCRCWLLRNGSAGFAINSAGCIISMFTNDNDLNLEMKLIDDCHVVGGWRFPDAS
jgi:hypothetical protein